MFFGICAGFESDPGRGSATACQLLTAMMTGPFGVMAKAE